jgi:hypothetical protein
MAHASFRRDNRGLVLLGMSIVIALAASIAAFAMLIVATSEARQGVLLGPRTISRYLAEAAYVRVTEFLWQNRTACPASVSIDVDGNGTITPREVVGVNVSPCGNPGDENRRRTITLQTVY